MADATLTALLQIRDSMSGGMQKAAQTVGKLDSGFQKLGKDASMAVKQIGAAGLAATKGTSALADSFGHVDRAALKMTARVAQVTARMVGFGALVNELGGSLKGGQFSQGLSAATGAMTVFASSMMAIPGPAGVIVGSLGAVGTMFKVLGDAEDEATAKLKKFREQLAETQREMFLQRGERAAELLLSKNPAQLESQRAMATRRDQLNRELADLEERRLYAAQREKSLQAQFGPDARISPNSPLAQAIAQNEERIRKLREQIQQLEADIERGEGLQSYKDRMQAMGEESERTRILLATGLVTPLEAAETASRNATKALEELLAAQQSFGEVEFAEKLVDLEEKAKSAKARVDALREEEKGKKELAKEEQKAAQETSRAWTTAIGGIADSVSAALASAVVDGKKFSTSFKSIWKRLQYDLVKSLTDSLIGGVAKQLTSSIASIMPSLGIGGGGAVPTAGGSGGLNLGSLGISQGTSDTIGGIAGAGVAAYGGYEAAMAGDTTGATIGGALAGAQLGMLVGGPIGALAGALIGGAAGYFTGNRKKKKAKKRERRQAAAMEALQAQQREEAKKLLVMDIRNRLGGGLSSEEQLQDLGGLFSAGISDDEISKFDQQALLARRDEIESAAASTTNNINVGSPNIQVVATINGAFDVSRIAEDLGMQLVATIHSAAAGASPGV